MARFDTQIDTAQRLINRNGEKSTLRRKVDGAPPDVTKPWRPGTPTFTDTTVDAVWLDYDSTRIAGGLVKAGDQQVLIPAKGLTITPDQSTDHLVRVDGQKWTIVTVNTLDPNGQQILYDLQVRRGG